MLIPFLTKQKIQSTIVESFVRFEKVELDVDIPDERFSLPKPAPATDQ